ncbi:MAG: 50S ribosomal protein L1 [Spirochaetes bacterium]|nr:50S ribosomal protein L1 [Spirochaetota bacterium]
MAKKSKKYKASVEKVDREKIYSLEEALKLVKEMPKLKYDESLDIQVRLHMGKGQRIRGVVTFPHIFGKPKKVLVLAKGEKAEEAKKAGADYVGDSDLIEKVQKGWFDFDAVVATPDMMKEVSKLGPTLGRKGLMPNPKTGTVTFELKQAVGEIKKGKTEFKSDKTGIVALSTGKVSMEEKMLSENISEFYSSLLKTKPHDVKGEYIRSVSISKTMGPGLKINYREFQEFQ